MRTRWAFALAALLSAGCGSSEGRRPSEALFVGIDVSGSFHGSGDLDDSLAFLSRYLHARLEGHGGLQPLKALYVGSIGGQLSEETKSFFPIHAFQGKTAEQIEADLKAAFPKSDRFTDFSSFFRQVAVIAQKRNLSLSPIPVVLLSDGIPALTGRGEVVPHEAPFSRIELAPLEFLSRKVTVRLLYAPPMVAAKWETAVARRRVRVWTLDANVMRGWKEQVEPGAPAEAQEKLHRWIADNVDFRVKPVRTRVKLREQAEDDAAVALATPIPAPAPKAKPVPKAPAKTAPKKVKDGQASGR